MPIQTTGSSAVAKVKAAAKQAYSTIGHYKEYYLTPAQADPGGILDTPAATSTADANPNYVSKKNLIGGKANTSNVPSYVPPKYVSWVQGAAKGTGLPASVVAAQINDESGFNPDAVSPTDAKGIAQFEDSTWKSNGSGSPFDPAAAQKAYIKLMGTLLKQYNGNVRNALAAYNAGPGNLAAGYGYADNILSASGANPLGNSLKAGATSAASTYGGTRPGGQPANSDGTPQDTGQSIDGVFAAYQTEIDQPRVAPASAYTSGLMGPFKWWLASATNNWQDESSGSDSSGG